MPKFIQIAILLCLCFTSTAFAQEPLDNLPVQVGGYVYDQQNQPISDASVTFIDQTTFSEYQGFTDATGWYGNLGYSAVPELPQTKVLGSAYPNPFGNSTSIEIHSEGLEKSSGSGELEIYDVRGRLVGSVPAISGSHQVQTTNNGSLPSGAYFYRLGNETRKFVGSPKWISIKTTSASAEKSMVDYQMIVEADGFVVSDELVSLDDGQVNYQSLNLIPASDDPTLLAVKIFNISASECLLDGTLTLSRGDYSQTETAGVDSLYDFTIPAGVDSVAISLNGFVGYEGTPANLLRLDDVAARSWVADEETPAPVDSLENTMNVYVVSEERMNDQQFVDALLYITHRYEAPRIILYLNTEDSGFTEPALEGALDQLRDGLNRIFTVYAGGELDNLPLMDFSYEETTEAAEFGYPDDPRFGRHDIWVENDSPPGNYRVDLDGDDCIDYARSSVRESNGVRIMMDELLGPCVLYDNPDEIAGAYDNDGNITPKGVDMLHAVHKSRLGRDYRVWE